MTAYYCDLALDFVDRSGADSGANVLTGPGGFDAAIHGQGAATALVAGDTLYLKGTGDLSRLVLIDCNGTDVSAWAAGNVVRNKDGAGDDWTGVVVRANDDPAGGMTADDMVLVQLAAGKDSTDIDLADGIENTTLAESADPLAAVTTPGIQIDKNSGNTTTGNINFIGCDAAWAARAGQAVLDGFGLANACTGLSAPDRLTFDHLTMQNSAGNGIDSGTSFADWLVFIYCNISNNTANGIGTNASYNRYSIYAFCVVESNTGSAFGGNGLTGLAFGSRIKSNSTYGAPLNNGNLIDCLVCGNGDDNCSLYPGSTASIISCVLDGSGAGSGIKINAGAAVWAFGSRVTNNANYGSEEVSVPNNSNIEDYNVFFNNTNGDLQNIVSGSHSYGDGANHVADPTSSGYTKRTLLVEYNTGVNMNNASVDDTVTNGTWTAKVRTVPTGAVTGTFELDTLSGGNPAVGNNLTLGGVETCTITAVAIQDAGANATDWNILAGAEIDGTGADSEVDLFWDGGDSEGAAWLTAGLPREIVAGGGATRLIGGVLA